MKRKTVWKKLAGLTAACCLLTGLLTGCGASDAGSAAGDNGEVIVYNWGEYIDPDTLEMFESETGIRVIYDEFETNEIMYPKVEAGASVPTANSIYR